MHRSTSRLLLLLMLMTGLATSAAFAAAPSTEMLEFPLRASTGVPTPRPVCGRTLDLDRLMAVFEKYPALTAGDPTVIRRLDSVDRIVDHLAAHQVDWHDLVKENRAGANAQCESACVVLPANQDFKQFRLSDRSGSLDQGFSMARAPLMGKSDRLPKRFEDEHSFSQQISYTIARTAASDRVVCATARNWGTTPAMQRVEIRFADHEPAKHP